jgi:hypothetical protein
MPVDTKHKEYLALAPLWAQMRDFAAGQAAVHAAGEKYLPRLINESDEAYKARLCRANLFGATGRTIEGLAGMLFRSKPECKVSTSATPMLDDVTKSGESMDEFAARVAIELETINRVAVLVDYPEAPPGPMTVAQVEALNIRPHLARYTGESLINWEYGWVNNKTMLTMAVLYEQVNVENPDDPFLPRVADQWRELRLVDGVYVAQLWRRIGAGTADKFGEPVIPRMNGKPLNEIPLYIFGDGRPPLMALCDVNKSHYQTTADIEHGAHLTALPQAWAAGELRQLDPQTSLYNTPTLYIGGGDLWTFPTGTQVGMLEYTGQGLGALENRLKSKESQMAVLGARMLEAQKTGVEAADTAGMHRAGEQSILQRQAGELSVGLQKALAVFDKWAGGSGDVTYQINKDFLPTALTAQEITALVQAWQSGAISHESLFDKFQRGGVVSEGLTYEDEQTKIANNPPVLSAPALPPADPASTGGAGA